MKKKHMLTLNTKKVWSIIEMLERRDIKFEFDPIKELGSKDHYFDKFYSRVNNALE